jgi:hypothetical protein
MAPLRSSSSSSSSSPSSSSSSSPSLSPVPLSKRGGRSPRGGGRGEEAGSRGGQKTQQKGGSGGAGAGAARRSLALLDARLDRTKTERGQAQKPVGIRGARIEKKREREKRLTREARRSERQAERERERGEMTEIERALRREKAALRRTRNKNANALLRAKELLETGDDVAKSLGKFERRREKRRNTHRVRGKPLEGKKIRGVQHFGAWDAFVRGGMSMQKR